jgi:hypothetical protein
MDSGVTTMKLWTPDEIEKIRSDFGSGKKIKVIASELGRSMTAVNKFLSRAGIRQKKRKKYVPSRRRMTQDSSCWIPIPPSLPEYSEFNDVVLYLREKGHDVRRLLSSSRATLFEGATCMIDGRPISKVKLLLLANRLRIEAGEPVFKVVDIMFDED